MDGRQFVVRLDREPQVRRLDEMAWRKAANLGGHRGDLPPIPDMFDDAIEWTTSKAISGSPVAQASPYMTLKLLSVVAS
jgi:hypothetical protein